MPRKKNFRLEDVNADLTPGISGKPEAEAELERMQQTIAERQEALFVNASQSVLVVLQGMDASGKDGAIGKVFSRVNPAGVEVTSFKVPTPLERQHDFLWRIHAAVPAYGKLGVFNRSHYEDVAVVRVNSDKLLSEEQRNDAELWNWRHDLINKFERMLTRNGMVVLKFFLHISNEEQLSRFKARQADPEKHWKLNQGDLEERKHWDKYMDVYSNCISATHTEYAPWHVIPANRKWYRNYAIAKILSDKLNEMTLPAPKVADPALLSVEIK